MNTWSIWEEEVLRNNSTKDKWLAPEELGTLLGRSAKQISDKRERIGLKPTEEQRKLDARKRTWKETFTKKCLLCGKEFKTKIKKQIYCSKKCYNFYRNKQLYERNCKVCGKLFYSQHSEYCSKECRFANRYKKNHHMCENCGKDFINYKSEKKFCSANCHNLWLKTHASRKMFESKCLGCEKLFTARYKGAKYCSKECSYHRKRPDLGQRNKERKVFSGLRWSFEMMVTEEMKKFLQTKKNRAEYIRGLIEADM